MTTLKDVRDAMAAHRLQLLPDDGKRRAAVAVVLCEASGILRLLFIERTEREDDPWSGHLAFPGGQVEEHDRTFRDTAERDTWEEIGLDLCSGAFLGQLDDVSGATVPIVVSGFVYSTVPRAAFVLSHEVQDAFWFSLDELLDLNRHKQYCYQYLGAERTLPAIDLLGPGRPILWGLTYRFVAQLLKLLGHEIPGSAEA